ncbi:hypothetical protein K505DRAFT_344017 [Melanomma pulvis-pyrius CBS 109.77]|uniref:Uncharacterized protein n=1 Tax=Melanomma pulvis-pyrius CBS 109.77 TaxID=1314802 RepID=A0A6A6WQ17_9PLEO|nr:hypothetical protein K505DRAFT_344017 [Melanomma pulvis-pyrius CBS 109.77]
MSSSSSFDELGEMDEIYDSIMANVQAGTASKADWESLAVAGKINDIPPYFLQGCLQHLLPEYLQPESRVFRELSAALIDDSGSDEESVSSEPFSDHSAQSTNLDELAMEFISSPAENSSDDESGGREEAWEIAARISALFPSEEDSKENSSPYTSLTLDVSTDPRSVVPDAGYPDFPDDQHGMCNCEYSYIPYAREQGALELVWRLFGGNPYRREDDEHVQRFRKRTYSTSSEFGNGRSPLSNVENADDIEDVKEHETSVSVCYAVDRFVKAVKRPFSNKPLSTCNFEDLCRHQRALEEARSKKIIFSGFRHSLRPP